jgi:uncharacterized membrane protein YphA (DoxX/SURF4 family)
VAGRAFAIIGLRNIGNHKPMADFLAATGIVMQVGFGVLMAVGLLPIVAAVGLLIFTVLATLMAHSFLFWTFADKAERTAQMEGGLLALVAAAI